MPGMKTRFAVFCIQYAAHHEKELFAQSPPASQPIIAVKVAASSQGDRNRH